MSKIEDITPDDVRGKEYYAKVTEWLEEQGIDFTAYAKPMNDLYVILSQEQDTRKDKKVPGNRQKLLRLGFELGGYQAAMPEYFFFRMPMSSVYRKLHQK